MPRHSGLLRTLVDHLPSMVAYWDSGLRCRFANRAFERWLGMSPEDLVGKHVGELVHTPILPSSEHIERALRGEPQEVRRELPDPAGGPPHAALVSYVPHVVDGVVRGFYAMVTDVSAIEHAQRALRDSEERFRLTFEEAPIGMALVDLDERFVRTNRALCEILHTSTEGLVGMACRDVIHPDDRELDDTLVRRLLRGEIPRFQLEKRLLRSDGSTVVVNASRSVLRTPEGAPLQFVLQIEDVAERHEFEDRLRLAEAISSGILAIAPDAIVSFDEERRITRFNTSAERIFGWPKGEVIGQPFDLLIPERFRARLHEHVDRFAVSADVAMRLSDRGITMTGLRRSGEEFPADGSISRLAVGTKKVLTIALRDVTEQRRAERAQRLLADVGAALASTLDEDETLSRLTELAVREVADVCIVDLVEAGEAVPRVEVVVRRDGDPALHDAFLSGPPERGRGHLLGAVLGSARSILLSDPAPGDLDALAHGDEQAALLRGWNVRSFVAAPLVARTRLLGAIAMVSRTASHRYGPADLRLVEEIARRAALAIDNARLYRAARRASAARDEVLGIVAHDLRSPLNSIVLNARLVRRRLAMEPDRPWAKPLEAIERSAAHILRLIGDLLDVTRVEAGHLTIELARVPVRPMIEECIEAHRALAAEQGVDLGFEAASTLPDVWADRDRLLQVFENLIGNALKFTGAGGRITVVAAAHGDQVAFSITDTGGGIAAEDVQHLFDRFWQAKETRQAGAGLGLAIVKGIVEAHGGRVSVDSEPGLGTTVRFTVPCAAAAHPTTPERHAPGP